MNYEETLQYLFEHLPMYQRIGAAAYKKDLSNTLELCSLLGNPQNEFTSIHIGGTNGKGSVSNMLASVFIEAGYTTGLYTSPHLTDFRERIRVNGQMCEKEFVVDFIQKHKLHIERIQPSFFELTVAMAFDYFAKQNVELAVIEVGLGGRLDSTNIVTPILSVITNISFDHMAMLGNTLPEIAFEKAGIMKPQVPVVIGEIHNETFPVFQKKAQETGSELFLAEENTEVDILEHTISSFEVNVSYKGQLVYPELHVGLMGNYQVANLRTVIQAIEVLRQQKIEIPEDAVYDGIAEVSRNTGFAGRFEVISRHPLTIVDCAHNSDGLHQLFLQVNELQFDKLFIVTGMVNDKDTSLALKEMPVAATYFFSKPSIPRGLEATILQAKAAEFGLNGDAFNTVPDALAAAWRMSETTDLILICGSIFVAAEALTFFNQLKNSST